MDAEALTVLCANVGNKWHQNWVYRLHQMVEQNCSVPFKFYVVTDPFNAPKYPEEWVMPLSRTVQWTEDHHSQIPSHENLILNRDKPQGCWAKLDFFIDQYGPDPIIGLDLDICILDDIAPLARTTLHMPIDTGKHLNGSIYSFTPGKAGFKPPRKIPFGQYPRGEQEYVANCTGAQPLPDCHSFKLNVASRPAKEPPPGTRIVFFHGRPTPADDSLQSIHWISRTWKGIERVERI